MPHVQLRSATPPESPSTTIHISNTMHGSTAAEGMGLAHMDIHTASMTYLALLKRQALTLSPASQHQHQANRSPPQCEGLRCALSAEAQAVSSAGYKTSKSGTLAAIQPTTAVRMTMMAQRLNLQQARQTAIRGWRTHT